MSENVLLQLKSTIVVLFSERLANFKSAYYTDDNEQHTKYMNTSILELLRNVEKDTLLKILSYYTDKLNTDSWKTEIGALNGFTWFLQRCLDGDKFKDQWIHFSLSIGFKLTQIHEDDWKSLGLSVLDAILTKGVCFVIYVLFYQTLELNCFFQCKQQIKEANIHNLIYEEISKIILSSSRENLTYEANNSLLLYLNFADSRSDEWGKRDDIIQLNIQKLRLSSSIEFCRHILDTISEVASKGQLESIFQNALTSSSLETLLVEFQNYNNTLAMRWTKTILETISHIAMFLNTTNVVKAIELLASFNRSYLVFVYLVPKRVLRYQLHIIEKLVLTLFETTTIHQDTDYLDVSFRNMLLLHLNLICFHSRPLSSSYH